MSDATLASVASAGNRLTTLRALRDFLAEQLDACEAKRDAAALSQRLMDVLEQIADVEKAQPASEGTALDEFTRRRTDRQAPRSSSAAKRQQRR
jgi:hypothetical protein